MPLNPLRILQFVSLLALSLYIPSVSFTGKSIFFSHLSSIKYNGDTIVKGCPKSEPVEKIITEAISIGVPAYNSGYHLACNRKHERAAFKILYEYGKD
jgi:hypothetical protein